MSQIWNHNNKSDTNYRLGNGETPELFWLSPYLPSLCLFLNKKRCKFLHSGQVTKNMPKSFPH